MLQPTSPLITRSFRWNSPWVRKLQTICLWWPHPPILLLIRVINTILSQCSKTDHPSPGVAHHALVLEPDRPVVPVLQPQSSGERTFLTRWQRELKLHRDAQPELSLKQSRQFLFMSVNRGRWTSIHCL